MAGLYFEQFTVGRVLEHEIRRTVTESDNVWFCGATYNPAQIHIDAEYCKGTEFGRPLVNSIFTLGLVVFPLVYFVLYFVWYEERDHRRVMAWWQSLFGRDFRAQLPASEVRPQIVEAITITSLSGSRVSSIPRRFPCAHCSGPPGRAPHRVSAG